MVWDLKCRYCKPNIPTPICTHLGMVCQNTPDYYCCNRPVQESLHSYRFKKEESSTLIRGSDCELCRLLACIKDEERYADLDRKNTWNLERLRNDKYTKENKMKNKQSPQEYAIDGADLLVQSLIGKGYKSEEDLANFRGTPERVAKAYDELVLPLKEIKHNLEKIISTSFPMSGDPGIVIQDCVTVSICPHHLLPVIHQMYVGYLPKDKGKVLGMSKIIRIADLLSRRAILQERLAVDITATLFNGHYDDDCENPTGFPYVDSKGAICVMGSLHCCMATRGVRSFSLAREVSLRGEFFHNPAVKSEALSIINQFPSKQFPL